MRLVLDLYEIKQIAKLKRQENTSFRLYLEGLDSEKTDRIVHRLNIEIAGQIDCVKCGNCCMNLRPVVDVQVLKLFVKDEDMEEYKYSWGFPCKNIDDKKCTIYQDRPEECRLYPYLDTDNFIERLHGVLQNYEICPIVYNVYESLKVELGWTYIAAEF